uniref:Uncharacterized protein n=1 Tax=Arundo donax TaxID=35708 RepID=A0A0A9GS27_ARUDO
MRVLGAAPR